MAFDFQGTLTVSQLDRLKTYVRDQVQLIDARIAHLKAERDRVGNLAFAYDSGGLPTALSDDPPSTYCGQLYGAYVALGGDAEFDLQVRSTSQAVYQLEGDESQPSELMSNGEVISVLGLSDAESALLVQQMRGWVEGDLHRRRDYIERKIRRSLDYAEQLTAEISELETLKLSVENSDSLEAIIAELDTLSSDRTYMPITDDSGGDPHGKFSRAPVAGYMPGPKGAIATTHQRTLDGLAVPED